MTNPITSAFASPPPPLLYICFLFLHALFAVECILARARQIPLLQPLPAPHFLHTLFLHALFTQRSASSLVHDKAHDLGLSLPSSWGPFGWLVMLCAALVQVSDAFVMRVKLRVAAVQGVCCCVQLLCR